MCLVLGVVVSSEQDQEQDSRAATGNTNAHVSPRRTLLVANSVSVFDHLVLDLLVPNYVVRLLLLLGHEINL
jgi:hypothetical protein